MENLHVVYLFFMLKRNRMWNRWKKDEINVYGQLNIQNVKKLLKAVFAPLQRAMIFGV